MSKRGTENQITKDDYDRGDDDESSSIMGTFKKASSDELAKRPIRTLRRLGQRTVSDLSDDGAKKPSVFASMGSSFSNPAISQPLSDQTKTANPFANINFGAPPANTTSTPITTTNTTTTATTTKTTPTTSAANIPKQSNAVFGSVFGQPAINSGSSTANSSFSSGFGNASSTPSFSNNAFTFNVGSNAKPLTMPDTDSSKGYSGGVKDREAYQRALRGVNTSFVKKMQKEMEHNPTVNMAQIFQQYIDARIKVRKEFRGIEEPRAIVLNDSKDGDSTASSPGGLRTSAKLSRMGSGSSDSPKISFGLPVDITATNSSGSNKKSFGGFGGDNSTSTSGATASLAAPTPAASSVVSPSGFSGIGGTASMFGFGSSTMKGAVDPPKNPTSGWNFGTPAISAPSSSSVSSVPFSSAATSSGLFSSSTSNAVTTPKPFSFNPPPKPFAFSTPPSTTATSAGGPPKPFAFQLPTSGVPLSSDAAGTQGDEEKMPDDTKSELMDNREGEENETTVFEVRAKLFTIVDNEYKDLGVGQFRVNENSETKKRRMIMRTTGTGLLTLNSWVIQGMPPKREKNNVTLFAIEEGKPKKFVLRVKEEQAAKDAVQAMETGQDA
ncbi:hypothetical protein BGZ46_003811 [Entomortierella lignicola]|nr:hypothetical protein BGZ46_003811 [Entomortierella lignicola]